MSAWNPIADLPANWSSLAVPELSSFGQVWMEQRERLLRLGALEPFTQRLERELAIETGVLENLYSIDRGVTVLLIEKGFDAALLGAGMTNRDPAFVMNMIQDHKEAIDCLFDFIRGDRKLSTSFIKELHALMTRHQPTCEAVDSLGRVIEVELVRGSYKKLPNQRTVGEKTLPYCPPEHVEAEMDRLIALHLEHSQAGVAPEVEAAWLHHAFTLIHPFQDGNGRLARCLANLVMIRAHWLPLVIRGDDGPSYIEALRQADAGDLAPLVAQFAAIERRAMLRALSVGTETEKSAQVHDVLTAIRRDLQRQKAEREQDHRNAEATAQHLITIATDELGTLGERLREAIADLFPDLECRVFRSELQREHYWQGQTFEVARHLEYYANVAAYRDWTTLQIRRRAKGLKTQMRQKESVLLIDCHGLGYHYEGILAISASYFERGLDRDRVASGPATGLCSEVFQVNYVESKEDAERRFRSWLAEVLAVGLRVWHEATRARGA